MAYDDDDDLAPGKLAAIVSKRQDDAVVIEKAAGDDGPHALVGSLLRHLQDRLDRRRAAHGFEKSERESTMNRTQELRDIVKTNGIIAVAKAMVEEGRGYGLTEEEFTEIATEDAVRKFPDARTPAAAFSQMFTDGTANGLMLRQAHRVVRAEQLGSTYAKAADRGPNSAYDELMTKAKEHQAAHPELSEAQAFAKVYADPANAALSKRERAESSPR
jgi:hypothetical protein